MQNVEAMRNERLKNIVYGPHFQIERSFFLDITDKSVVEQALKQLVTNGNCVATVIDDNYLVIGRMCVL